MRHENPLNILDTRRSTNSSPLSSREEILKILKQNAKYQNQISSQETKTKTTPTTTATTTTTTTASCQPKCVSGKVSLVAIVHNQQQEEDYLNNNAEHNSTLACSTVESSSLSNSSSSNSSSSSSKSSSESSSSSSESKKLRPNREQMTKALNGNDEKTKLAHSITTRQKFAKLFSRNSQTTTSKLKKQVKEEGEVKSNESVELNEFPMNTNCNNTIDHNSTIQQQQNKNKSGEVIEFKFDLIVDNKNSENNSEQQQQATANSNKLLLLLEERKLRDQVNELVESLVFDSNDVCLMSAGSVGKKHMLRITSAVADNLRCEKNSLSSTSCSTKNYQSHDDHTFDHIFQLAKTSSTYAFELLQAAANCEKVRKNSSNFFQQQLLRTPNGLQFEQQEGAEKEEEEEDSQKVNNSFGQQQQQQQMNETKDYSIEISATLFVQDKSTTTTTTGTSTTPTQSQWNSFDSIDLLRLFSSQISEHERSTTTTTKTTDAEQEQTSSQSTSSIECWSIVQALECLGKIQENLNHFLFGNNLKQSSAELLLITLKLKQKINSGLFSNRMWLLDFREPQTSELRLILESIFSGQALAHLRRRTNHLEALKREEFEEENSSQLSSLILDSNNNNNNFKHHHIASNKLSKLIQAEWLIYKQLSSALIRTLVLVHVHKLNFNHRVVNHNNEQVGGGGGKQLMVDKLLDYNLTLLKFARDIQRASVRRLKRRQRHLARTRELVNNFDGLSMEHNHYHHHHHHANYPGNFSVSNLSLIGAINGETETQTNRSDLIVSTPTRFLSKLRTRIIESPIETDNCDCFKAADAVNRKFSLGSSCSCRFCNNKHQLFEQNKRSRGHHKVCRRTNRNHYHHHHSNHRQESSIETTDYAKQPNNTKHNFFRSTSARSDSLALTESSSLVSSESSASGSNSLQQATNFAKEAKFSDNNKMWWSKYQRPNINMVQQQQQQQQQSNRLTKIKNTTKNGQQSATVGSIEQSTSSTLVNKSNSNSFTQFATKFAASDTEDSLASAYLNSCASSSSSALLQVASRQSSVCRRDVELRWLAKQQQATNIVMHQQQTVDIIDKKKSNINLERNCFDKDDDDEEEEEDLISELESTNVVVAEPPQQLKLEQFLSQLNTIIQMTPKKESCRREGEFISSSSKVLVRPNVDELSDDFLNPTNNDCEEDEDCKSHSSILEHLSSLAFESKQKQQQHQQV